MRLVLDSCSRRAVLHLPISMMVNQHTLVHVSAGTVHGFNYGAGGGEMLEFIGHGGFATQMFTAVNDEIPPGPPDIPKVLGILKNNGATVDV